MAVHAGSIPDSVTAILTIAGLLRTRKMARESALLKLWRIILALAIMYKAIVGARVFISCSRVMFGTGQAWILCYSKRNCGLSLKGYSP